MNIKKKLNFTQFIGQVFPYKSPFERNHFGPVTNFIKVFALRCAFILYRMGVTANGLDLFSLCLVVPSFTHLYLGLSLLKINYFIIGYIGIVFVLFIDFVDGSLAKIHKYKFEVGEYLDDLPPEIIRMGTMIIIGLLSNNITIIVMAFWSTITLNIYGRKTKDNIPDNSKWILFLAGSRMSLTGIRLLVCFILPINGLIYFQNQSIGSSLSILIIIVYSAISISWILLTLRDKTLK